MFQPRSMIMIRIVLTLAWALMLAACGTPPATTNTQTQSEPGTAATAAPATEAPVSGQAATAPAEETAPAAAGGEQVTLLVWDQHADAASDAADRIYGDFMQKHPNITIQRELVPLDQMRTTAKTALTSGTGPDIIYHDVSPGREMFRAGLLMDLESAASQYGWKDRFYEAGLTWSIADGKLYGLGLEYEFVGVFYNKTLIEQEGLELPETLQETLDFCEKAKEKDLIAFAHSQNPGYQNYFSFTMPLHNIVGIEDMEKLLFDGQGRWDSPEVIRAIEVVDKDMRDAGCFVEDVNGLGGDEALDLFIAGKALTIPIGTWIVGDTVEGVGDKYEIEMMPFPAIEGGKGGRVYTAGMGSAYMVSAATKHPTEAALFLDYLFSDEAVKIWIEEAGFIPPVPAETAGLSLAPLQQYVIQTLQDAATGKGTTKLGYNVDLVVPETFNTMMRDGFQAVMAGTKTPEAQAADLQRLWDERPK